MSAKDLPYIDKPAENDREAQNKFMGLFTERNGFRAREQRPDNGTDYMVELLVDKRASHRHFAVQLKSIFKPNFIHEGRVISYRFQTSRLWYLLQHLPKVGLIVIYSVNDGKIYFDYITDIYTRIVEEKGNNDWLNNDWVNIHISIANELTTERLAEIHKRFMNVFQLTEDLQLAFGPRYGLQVIPELKGEKIDFNDPEDITKVLKSYGLSYLSQNDLSIVYDLLSRLPEEQILRDKDLLIVKTVLKSMIGLSIDSNFYAEKLRKKFSLTCNEETTIRSFELHNKLTLGIISTSEFIAANKDLAHASHDVLTQISLRINTLYFQLLSLRMLESIDSSIENEIYKLDDLITNLPESNTKYELKIRNVENLGLLFGYLRNVSFIKMSVRDSLNHPLTLEERREEVITTINMHEMFHRMVHSIREYAKTNDNKLLRAEADCVDLRFELNFQISMMTVHKARVDDQSFRISEIRANNACAALDVFMNYNMYRKSYYVICDILEFGFLMEHHHQRPLKEIPFDKLIANQRFLESELDLEGNSYQLFMPALLQKIYGEPKMSVYSNVSEDQLRSIAKIIVDSGKYPNAELKYVLADLKAHQLFEKRCTDGSIELNIEFEPSLDEYYTRPARYILVMKESGIISDSDTDLDRLLTNWGY